MCFFLVGNDVDADGDDVDDLLTWQTVAVLFTGAENKESRRAGGGDKAPVVIGELDDWLAKRSNDKDDSGTSTKKRRKTLPKYSLPPHLTGVSDLPPSLLPPTKDDFVNLPLLEWG